MVFFKLQLVMFFEGIRSERELIRVAADRLSLRWYLGYDLDEELPDHSSLTRIRQRYGLAVFRRFFEAIVEQCREAGLVWGKELYFDATQVKANASLDSLAPRFAVEAHLGELFTDDAADEPSRRRQARASRSSCPSRSPRPSASSSPTPTRSVTTGWPATARPIGPSSETGYRRRSDFEASTTDPDAALMAHKKGGLHFGYHDHYAVDGGKARIILEALVTPADVMENLPFLDLLWRVCFRWQLRPDQVTGDTTYGTVENIVALEDQAIRAYVPLPDFDQRTPFYRRRRASPTIPSATSTAARRPGAAPTDSQVHRRRRGLPGRRRDLQRLPAQGRLHREQPGTAGPRGPSYAEYLDRVRAYHETAAYEKAMRKRKVWVEPLFGEAKDWHGLRRFRLRGLWKVNIEALLIAAGQNLKRLLRKRGWGRRPWPNGAPEAPCSSAAGAASARIRSLVRLIGARMQLHPTISWSARSLERVFATRSHRF